MFVWWQVIRLPDFPVAYLRLLFTAPVSYRIDYNMKKIKKAWKRYKYTEKYGILRVAKGKEKYPKA